MEKQPNIDFEKSQGSYLYDKISKNAYLDFFGMYATLALGYNHPIFNSEDFKSSCENCYRLQRL